MEEKNHSTTVLITILIVLVIGLLAYILFVKPKKEPIPDQQPNPSDISNHRELKVISPNGGESFRVGDTMSIIWETSCSSSAIVLYDEAKKGDVYVIYEKAPVDGKFDWKIPTDINSGQYSISLRCDYESSNTDVSDKPFSIQNDISSSDYNLLKEKYAVLLPSITAALKKDLGSMIGNDRPISVSTEADITGDGVRELLINTGTGGATMDQFSIVKIENGQPKIVKIKDSKGVVSNFSGMAGSGGAGRYGGGVQMIPDKNGILVTSHSVYGEPNDNCGGSVYVWNSQTKIFEYNKNLSEEETQKRLPMCYEMAESSGVTYQGKE